MIKFNLPYDRHHYSELLEKGDAYISKFGSYKKFRGDMSPTLVNELLFQKRYLGFAPEMREAEPLDTLVWIPYPKNIKKKYDESIKAGLGLLKPSYRYSIVARVDDDLILKGPDKPFKFPAKENPFIWIIKNYVNVAEELEVDLPPFQPNNLLKYKHFQTEEVKSLYTSYLSEKDAYLTSPKELVRYEEGKVDNVFAAVSIHRIEIGDSLIYIPFDSAYPSYDVTIRRKGVVLTNLRQYAWMGYNEAIKKILKPGVRYEVIDFDEKSISLVEEYDDESYIKDIPFYNFAEVYLYKNADRLKDFDIRVDRLPMKTRSLIQLIEQVKSIEKSTIIKTCTGDETLSIKVEHAFSELIDFIDMIEQSLDFISSSITNELNSAMHLFVEKILIIIGDFGITSEEKELCFDKIEYAMNLIETVKEKSKNN